jgi:hypothetical protein
MVCSAHNNTHLYIIIFVKVRKNSLRIGTLTRSWDREIHMPNLCDCEAGVSSNASTRGTQEIL